MVRSATACMLATLLAMLLAAPAALGAGGNGHSAAGNGKGHGRGGTGGTSGGSGSILALLPDGSPRDLCTSFTQVTESPFTLADGSSEAGLEVASASWARLDTIRSRALEPGGLGYTRGLPRRWDVGGSITPWSGVGLTTGPVNGEATPSGFGGGSLKLRHTFFGVDSGGVALGVAGAIRVPGSSSSPGATEFEGTLSVPFAAALPFDFTFGAMAQAGSIANSDTTGHHARWLGSVRLEHDIATGVSGWVEGVSVRDREPGRRPFETLSGGLSAEAWGHVSLTVGVAMGRSGGTSDHGVFGGLGLHR